MWCRYWRQSLRIAEAHFSQTTNICITLEMNWSCYSLCGDCTASNIIHWSIHRRQEAIVLPPHTVMTVTRHTDPSLDCILMVSRGDVMTLMTGNGMNEKVERREVAGLVTGCRLAGTRCTALTLMVSTHHRSQHAVFTYPCIHLQHCEHTLCHCKYVQHCHCLSHHFSMIPPR